MLVNTLEPVLFSLGPLTVYWYGVLYALGVFTVYYYVRNEIVKGRLPTTIERFDSWFFWMVVAMVAGARLFEVLFYDLSYYVSNPLKILFVWEGGLSFHGGFIAVILVLLYWCKREKLSFFKLADALIVPTALAQAFGRLGNLFNHELPGRAFDGAWAIYNSPLDSFARHPVQIYEIGYNLVIFVTLLLLRKRLKPGQLMALFFLMYGAFRFVVEYFKEPEVMLGFFTIGQWLSVGMVVVGGLLWWRCSRIIIEK